MEKNLDQAAKNRADIADIQRKYIAGEITREQAKQLAQPVLDRINSRASEIAQKHGKASYPKLDFINAMRNSY
jgi:hypothetical protein